MSVDFEDAIDYPTRGDDVVKRFLIGGGIPSLLAIGFAIIGILSFVFPLFGILNIFLYPFAFAVGLLLTGYFVRVVQTTYAGGDEPPSFDEWTALLKDGGYAFLIGLVYSIPVIALGVLGSVVFVVLVGGGAALGGESAEAFAAMGMLAMLVFGVISLLYFAYVLVVGYFFPISLCIYADTGGVKSAFSRDRLTSMATEKDYVVAWIAQAGVLFVVQSFVGFLAMFLIGYLLYPLLPFVTFFVSMAAFYVFAQVYDDVVGASDVDVDGQVVETVTDDEDDVTAV